MEQETLKKFVLDPEWSKMEEFIFSHFESETDILSFDLDKSSEAVHAELIARQKIAQDIKSLKASFETAKGRVSEKKTSFR